MGVHQSPCMERAMTLALGRIFRSRFANAKPYKLGKKLSA
jgi:hypothetical protein